MLLSTYMRKGVLRTHWYLDMRVTTARGNWTIRGLLHGRAWTRRGAHRQAERAKLGLQCALDQADFKHLTSLSAEEQQHAEELRKQLQELREENQALETLALKITEILDREV